MHSARTRGTAWGVAMLAALTGAPWRPAQAQVYDPAAYASLGAFPTNPGTYLTLDTSSGVLSGGYRTFQGVLDRGGWVFTFDSINLPSTERLTVTGPAPAVILSLHDATVAGSVVVQPSGTDGPGQGGAGGWMTDVGGLMFNLLTSGGGGGGFGTPGDTAPLRAYDNSGHHYELPGGAGGPAYGDLLTQLQGGSRGGSAFNSFPGTGPLYLPGGLGGGAFELSALGHVLISGSVSALGQDGPGPERGGRSGTGGGAGGGILIAGLAGLDVTGTLDTRGGLGGTSVLPSMKGGDGGLGHVTLVYGGDVSLGPDARIIGQTNVVPEPAAFALLATGLACALVDFRRRSRAGRLE